MVEGAELCALCQRAGGKRETLHPLLITKLDGEPDSPLPLS